MEPRVSVLLVIPAVHSRVCPAGAVWIYWSSSAGKPRIQLLVMGYCWRSAIVCSQCSFSMAAWAQGQSSAWLVRSTFPGDVCHGWAEQQEKLQDYSSSKVKKWNHHPLRLLAMKWKSLPLPLLSASVGKKSSSAGDVSCRWKYDVEILPWETKENLKIATEVELGVVFKHQDKRDISEAEFVWTRSQQAEGCACWG